MWEITFDKPQEGKETTGGKDASLKIRRLARRMKHDVTKTIFSVGSFMYSYTRDKRVRVNGHVLGRTRCTESRGSSDCAARNPTGAIDSGTVAATGGAYRLVSGQTGGPDAGSFHLPNRDCGSGAMVATEFESQGRAIGQRGGSTVL